MQSPASGSRARTTLEPTGGRFSFFSMDPMGELGSWLSLIVDTVVVAPMAAGIVFAALGYERGGDKGARRRNDTLRRNRIPAAAHR